MALSLLNGTDAAISIKIDSVTPPLVEYNCHFRYVSADFVRDFTETTTFCGTGWRSRTPGMKQIVGRLDGYMSKGDVASNPGILQSNSSPMYFVQTFDTGCTYTGQLHVGRDHAGVQAAAQSERSIDWESYGAVTIAWVTT
jgi:hypothetical protein